MSATSPPADRPPRPPLRRRTPGSTGGRASETAGGRRGAHFTPGTLGRHDGAESGEGDAAAGRILLQQLDDGWKRLEEARANIVHLFELAALGAADDLESRAAAAWTHHEKLYRAYYAVLIRYVEEHLDPARESWGAIVRIGPLIDYDRLAQWLGDDDRVVGRRLVSKLAFRIFEKAFDRYRQTGDQEALFYCLTFAAELNCLGIGQDDFPPRIREMLQELIDGARPDSPEQRWKHFIDYLLTGIRPGQPLWAREAAKAIARIRETEQSDPIRRNWAESRRRGQL